MNPPSVSIFGFSTFISALALLGIVYTVSDIRYRFRVAITPIPLFGITFVLIALLGIGTLIIDIMSAEQWLCNQAIYQAILGLFFLLLVLIWIFFAVIKPPIFCKYNDKRFSDALYQAILKGSDTELPTIASEVSRSAKSIINLAKEKVDSSVNEKPDHKIKKCRPRVEDYAHDLLLLIGNRKFCQHIMASSPITAIDFFESMATKQKYDLPIGQFVKNISTEALINKNSILYHEDGGYRSGLIGYVKPFSRSIYGNYHMVEALAHKHGSPLDIDDELAWSLDATQLKAYCRCTMLTWKNYIETNNWHEHSYALYRAFDIVKNSCHDIYKLDAHETYPPDICNRLSTAVRFFKDAVEFLDNYKSVPHTLLRQPKGLYDNLTGFIFDFILLASFVKSPPDTCWTIHHNITWTTFFWFKINKGKTWVIILFKLRRKLYDEVLRLERYPNYESSGILGFLLNVMGLKIPNKNNLNKSYYSLHKAILKWTQKNYLKLLDMQPNVAESCLVGSISFDRNNSRLVKTYNKGLNLEAPKEYLVLKPYDNNK